jgi:hypothetical protein
LYDNAAARSEPSEQQSVWVYSAWLEASTRYLERLRREATEDCLPPEGYLAPIAMVASQVAKRHDLQNPLDIGEGIGPCVDAIIRGLLVTSYVVVDGAASFARLLIFVYDHLIGFIETLLIDGETGDIVFFGRSRQSSDSWRHALAALANRVAEYGTFVFNRIPVSPNERIAPRQHLSLGQPQACTGSAWYWVFSMDELIREVLNSDFLSCMISSFATLGAKWLQLKHLGA